MSQPKQDVVSWSWPRRPNGHRTQYATLQYTQQYPEPRPDIPRFPTLPATQQRNCCFTWGWKFLVVTEDDVDIFVPSFQNIYFLFQTPYNWFCVLVWICSKKICGWVSLMSWKYVRQFIGWVFLRTCTVSILVSMLCRGVGAMILYYLCIGITFWYFRNVLWLPHTFFTQISNCICLLEK